MINEEASSPIIPTSSSSSSSLAPAGQVAVKKPKEEEKPPAIVSSSSAFLQATTVSGHVKREKAEVKAEEVCRERSIDGHNARCKNDWEPGDWCWLLDDDNNCNSAPVLALKEETAVVGTASSKQFSKIGKNDSALSNGDQDTKKHKEKFLVFVRVLIQYLEQVRIKKKE